MGHPVRSVVVAAVVAVIGASWCGCTLNATGEGAYDDADGSVAGGGSGGSLPDVDIQDVSVEDSIPDIPAKPDVPCFPPQKVCQGTCDYPDPFIMGCSPNNDECDPCPQFAHAQVICLNGACALGACDQFYADCDSDPANGCETATNTLDDCGACGTTCSRDNATADCSTGECKIAQCVAPFESCDGADANGCEVNLHTVDHCGSCTAPLCEGPGPAQYTCVTGECKVDKCTTPLTADCDGDENNGCEVDLTTLTNCGACAVNCDRNHATPTCAGGTCAIAQCEASYGDCDSQDNNGCETNVTTSSQSCGSCGGACSTAHSTNAACQSGLCVNTCDNGFADCNGPQPGNGDDGCEIDITTDPSHCGGCPNVCSTNHVPTPSCGGGLCNGACDANYADCDNNKLSNGCEINTLTDIKNCGACGTVCSSNGGTPGCSNGQCTITCSGGRADCDSNVANGCEVNLTNDPNHCGSCPTVCSNNHMQSRTCAAGVCNGTCAAGYTDCNSNKQSDGCEQNTGTDPDHCGSCTTVCSGTNIPTRTCAGGTCNGACASGFADCNNNKQSDGCEINTTNDVNHCGSCPNVCNLPNANEGCAGGACTVVSCAAGFTNCNGTASDGCEINTTNDPNHCGSCATVCNLPNANEGCSGSVCTVASCAAGYANCNGVASDGCEINTTNDVNHCGSCSTVCNLPNANEGCASSACTVVSCSAGFENCNGTASDGCEINTTNDPNHCGSCSTVCNLPNANEGCASSACTIGSCTSGFANCNGTVSDGCEINTTNDPNHCGSCSTVCSLPNANEGCASSACTVASCTAGYANCNNVASDGCEINTTNDVNHCGGCSTVCNAPNANDACTSSACTIASCAAGYADCNSVASDGCEINTTNDANHCGGCTTVCNLPNAVESCSSSVCAIASCLSGYENCNGTVNDGCEINLNTDPLHCGACTRPCNSSHVSGAVSCSAGLCDTASCDPSWSNVSMPAAPTVDDGCETH